MRIKEGDLWMEREGEAVMVAVLESLVEEEPFHSSMIGSGCDDPISPDTSAMAGQPCASLPIQNWHNLPI